MMPPHVHETIIWVCVAAFIICLIGALLALFGFWEPKDPAVKKWLFTGLLFSVVGGVGTYATRAFGNGDDPQPKATSTAVPAATPAPSPLPTPVAAVTPIPRPSPAAEPESSVDVIPDAVKQWAETTLGPRPTLAAISAHPYPGCVAELRGMAADQVLADDAKACARTLARYHFNYVLPYYTVKQPYDERLDLQEERLRSAATEDDKKRYGFVVSEIARLNGAEWATVTTLDRTLRDDQTSCAGNLCQLPR